MGDYRGNLSGQVPLRESGNSSGNSTLSQNASTPRI